MNTDIIRADLRLVLDSYFDGMTRNPQFCCDLEIPKEGIKIEESKGSKLSIRISARIANSIIMDTKSVYGLQLATESYILGFVYGKYGIKPTIEVIFVPRKITRIRNSEMYITLAKAIKHRIISENAPLVKQMKNYNL